MALNDVQGGACKLRYFVDGNAALDATSGVITVGFESHRKVARELLDYQLEAAKNLRAVIPETDEQAMRITLLQLLCDKYEPLLANPDATLEELEAAIGEFTRVM